MEKEDVNDPNSGWTKKIDKTDNVEKDGYSVVSWGRKGQDGNMMFKSEMFLLGVSQAAFDKFFTDPDFGKDDPTIKEMKVLARDERGIPTMFYSTNKLTMMSLREILVQNNQFKTDDGCTLNIMQSVEHPDFPITDKAIRMYIFKASLARNVDGGVHLTEYTTMNMGGWFPMRLFNMMFGQMIKAGMPKIIEKAKKF